MSVHVYIIHPQNITICHSGMYYVSDFSLPIKVPYVNQDLML